MITLVTVIIVLVKKDMFFETRHVGRLLEGVEEAGQCIKAEDVKLQESRRI